MPTTQPQWISWAYRAFQAGRSALAWIGLLSTMVLLLAFYRPDAADWMLEQASQWLGVADQPTRSWAIIAPVELSQLPPDEVPVARWLGSKYRVAPEVVAALLKEAMVLSKTSKLDAHLIMAVMAIESNFHPYVRSQAGAQGLMQVMPKIHANRYAVYGGPFAAFDPISNLRVGVAILVDSIKLKGGSEDAGLIFYFGGGNTESSDDYVQKVRTEQAHMDELAAKHRKSTPTKEMR